MSLQAKCSALFYVFFKSSILFLIFSVAACDVAEKFCPDATCRTQMRFKGHLIKCVCNTDLCNRNITWTPNSEQPQLTYSYSVGMIIIKPLLFILKI